MVTSSIPSSLEPTLPTSPLASRAYQVGQTDILSQFHVSQKLYGRQDQVDELLQAFHRISTPVKNRDPHGGPEFVAPRPEMLLVCGYSGIGKTSVIDEVHKPMVQVFFSLHILMLFCLLCFLGKGNVWER